MATWSATALFCCCFCCRSCCCSCCSCCCCCCCFSNAARTTLMSDVAARGSCEGSTKHGYMQDQGLSGCSHDHAAGRTEVYCGQAGAVSPTYNAQQHHATAPSAPPSNPSQRRQHVALGTRARHRTCMRCSWGMLRSCARAAACAAACAAAASRAAAASAAARVACARASCCSCTCSRSNRHGTQPPASLECDHCTKPHHAGPRWRQRRMLRDVTVSARLLNLLFPTSHTMQQNTRLQQDISSTHRPARTPVATFR